MNERRNSYPFSFKWKAVFGIITFSGCTTVLMLAVGGGRALEQVAAIRLQLTDMHKEHATEYAAQVKLNGEFRGRIAELTTAVNEARSKLGLPPIIHQPILDGEPVVYNLPRKTEMRAPHP